MLKKLKDPSVLVIIIPLSAVAVLSRTFPVFSFFYYLLPLLFLPILFAGYEFVVKNKALRNILIFLFVFGIWCAVTSLWSDYPFISLSRSGYFIFISFGAVLGGYLWQLTDSNSFSFLFPANIIITAICIFSLITNIPADTWTGGNGRGFMGFAGHQNTLGSAILFTLPAIISQVPFIKGYKKGSVILLLILNLFILFLTFSRASILALVCGTIIFLMLNKKWIVLLNSAAAMVILLSIIWFFPSLKMEANKIIRKDFPAFYSTREWIWVPSLNAALKGGLFGIGYGISDPEIIVPGTGSHYDNGRYIREKGNSFLALTEEVGIVGLLLFILPVLYITLRYRMGFGNTNITPSSGTGKPVSGIALASFAAFIIHSQFEAWMTGVGSIQLPLFFFCMGCMFSPLKQITTG